MDTGGGEEEAKDVLELVSRRGGTVSGKKMTLNLQSGGEAEF